MSKACAILGVAAAIIVMQLKTTNAALPESFDATSRRGLLISFQPNLNPLVINRIHSWDILVRDASGGALTAAELTLRGGMPEHDHGMPTQPAVTAETEPGRYRMDGLRFHMPGLWRLELDIVTDEFTDTAVIEFRL